MAATSASIPPTTTDKCPIKIIHNHIQSLAKEDGYLLHLEESLPPDISVRYTAKEAFHTLHPISMARKDLEGFLELLEETCRGQQLSCDPHFHPATCCCPFQERPSMNQSTSKEIIDTVEPVDEQRYLCISNGLTICCLDLKQVKDETNGCFSGVHEVVPSKICTLELGTQDFPLSLGLLKLGSQAYMVGGQEFSPSKDAESLVLKDCRSDLKGFHSDLEVFRYLNEKYGMKGGSSSKTYHLSLADGNLHLSQCSNIIPQTNPKFWPIVDKIDDQIHVIETLPSLRRAEIPSHGVLNLNDLNRGWYELSPLRFPKADSCGMYISKRIAVGHRIYASTSMFCSLYGRAYDSRSEFVVFDAKRHKWELHRYPCEHSNFFTIKHVAEILHLGFGMCIGEYTHGASGDPLYVVLGIGDNQSGQLAIAYLVTTRGQVLCFQRLNLFFDGFEKPLYGLQTVINGGEEGKSNCVICQGYGTDTLYIITFDWDEVDDALALVSDLPAQSSDEDNFDKLAYVDEEDFINVAVKGCYVTQFGTGLPLCGYQDKIPTRLSACFLKPAKALAGPVAEYPSAMAETLTANTNHDTTLKLLDKLILKMCKQYKTISKRARKSSKKKKSEELFHSMLSYRFRHGELEKLKKALKLICDGQLSLNPHSGNASVESTPNTSIDSKEKAAASAVRGCEKVGAVKDLRNPLMSPLKMVAATHACSFQERSSLNEEVDNARYLCVYDGFKIYCLDLKKDESKRYESHLPSLPTISSYNLLEEGLPASMGLFKIGSDAYMVSGQEFPSIKNHPELEHPDELYKKYGFKGSSRKTHHLSLCDGKLSVFECNNVPQLKKAKFWPIVEKIGNRIHVIESIPWRFSPPDTIPSHEVLNLDERGCRWIKLSPLRYPEYKGFGMFIMDHLVVGDRIYAKAHGISGFMVLDSTTNIWVWCPDLEERSTMHVSDLLGARKGICVGEFPKRESEEPPLYVVIGTASVRRGDDNGWEMIAVTHLVTPTGQVLSSQDVTDIFDGLKPVSPTYPMIHSSLFTVDGQGETVCGVFLGSSMYREMFFLYICTFTVRAVQSHDKDAVGEEFVKVVVKDSQLYRVEGEFRAGGSEDPYPPHLSACFL